MKKWTALLLALVMLLSVAGTAFAVGVDTCRHDYKHIKHYDKKTTCTESGWGYWYCSGCNKILSGFDEPPLGHNWGPWEETVAPTCVDHGKEVRQCRRCESLMNRAVAPLGHDWGEWYRLKDPTPYMDGEDERDCQRCRLPEFRPVPYTGEEVTLSLSLSGQKNYNGPVPCVNKDIPIQLWAENTGNAELTNVHIYASAYGAYASSGTYTDQLIYLEDTTPLPAGESAVTGHDYFVTPEIAFLAPVTLSYYAVATGPNGEEVVSNIWSCELNTYCEDVPLKVEFTDCSAIAPKTVGAELTVEVTVTNISDKCVMLDSLMVHDAYNNDYVVYSFPGMIGSVNTDWFEPEQSVVISDLVIRVTEEDVNGLGYVGRTALAYGRVWYQYDEGETYFCGNAYSNEPSVEIPFEQGNDVAVYKEVLSTPQQAGGYAVNEVIEYRVSVTNLTDEVLHDVEVYDPLAIQKLGTALIGTFVELGAHETLSFDFYYTVETEDLIPGFVYNLAHASYQAMGQTDDTMVYSNEVMVPVLPCTAQLEVVKIELSFPQNGYYEKGDTIDYRLLVINNTEYSFADVQLYDSLNNGVPVLNSMALTLDPGEVLEGEFHYTVQDSDIDRSYVKNMAVCYYCCNLDLFRDRGVICSDPVYSPTGRIILPPSLPNPPTLGEPEHCKLTISELCAEGAMYDQFICTAHRDYVARAAQARNVDEVCAIWTEALDELYAKVLAGAASTEHYVMIENDKLAVLSYCTAFAEAERANGTSEQEIMALVSALMQRELTEACYLFNADGESRPDSYIGAALTLTADVTAACARDVYYRTDSDEMYMQTQCAAHKNAENAVLQAMSAVEDPAHTLNLWQKAYRIWNMELNTLEGKLNRSDAEGFKNHVTARTAVMNLYYDADTTMEVVTKLVMNRINDICR